ncbi:hypothetical protein TNCV_4304071 [Trichonephila clavipes]|nr:hypothetical protein TNCV_4304071 [Trichonephila clavipes]
MIKNVEFKTPNNEVLQETNLARLYDDMSEKIVKENEDFVGRDSGWTLDEILRLELFTPTPATPTKRQAMSPPK